MKHRLRTRLPALLLVLTLLLATAAQALTPEQARRLLTDYYIDPVPPEVLEEETIQGMTDALGDPYTQYFSAEEYAEYYSSMLDSTLVGIGISSKLTEEGLRLEHVYDDSPAQEGGLRPGDVIVAVDGQSTLDADLETISGWIAGEEGTDVELAFLRGGEERTVTLTRREVFIPATVTRLEDGHTGLIVCDTFGEETFGHFTEGIATYGEQASHWIVDLRSNTGGSVAAAIDSAGAFTGPRVLGYLRDGEGNYESNSANNPALTQNPVIVLSDPFTASASELFAAAIRDSGAGIVVGERSFGKGVAQVVFDSDVIPSYFRQGDAIKITAFRFFAPLGSTTDTVGIIPHLMVPASYAEKAARLLCGAGPAGSTEGILCLDMGGRWYIHLDEALRQENRAAFGLLLEAIPSSARLLEGAGGPDGWQDATPAAVAGRHGLDYQSRGFSDTEASPYSQAIDVLATYNIVSGVGDGAFDPEGALTRAQLCALLYQALGGSYYPATESAFSDVDLGAWYGQPVNLLANMGLVDGVGGGEFHPDDPVTHEQFFAIMGRMARRLNMYLYEDGVEMPAAATAAPSLDAYAGWARAEVWLLALSQQDEGVSLLWADPAAIDPAAVTTREEAASVVYELFTFSGILPG